MLKRACSLGLVAALASAQDAAAQSVYPQLESIEEESDDPQQDGVSVADAVNDALKNNPEISVAEAQLDIARSGRLRALGEFLPNIEASLAQTGDNFRSGTLETLQEQDGTTLGFSVSQPVFTGLSTLNRFKESRRRTSQYRFLLEEARQRIALQASRAHAGVMLARQNVAHRTENLRLLSEMLYVAQRRMEAGAQSRTGVEQARMRRSQAQVALGEARAALAAREAAYERIVGAPAPVILTPDDIRRNLAFETLDDALAAAVSNNPALNAAREGFEAAAHASDASKGAFAPTLSIEGNYYKRYGDSAVGQDDEEYQIVARARMPIFNQGRNIADLKSAAASKAQASAEVRAARLIVEESVMRAWRQRSDAQGREIAAREAIEAAALSVKGLQMEYEAGRRTIIDVLDGQRDLVTARISQSEAEYDARLADYELAAATGVILSPNASP